MDSVSLGLTFLSWDRVPLLSFWRENEQRLISCCPFLQYHDRTIHRQFLPLPAPAPLRGPRRRRLANIANTSGYRNIYNRCRVSQTPAEMGSLFAGTPTPQTAP